MESADDRRADDGQGWGGGSVSAPFRPPHGEDCPECYPDPSGRQILLMTAIVLTPALALLLWRWLS